MGNFKTFKVQLGDSNYSSMTFAFIWLILALFVAIFLLFYFCTICLNVFLVFNISFVCQLFL